MAGLNEDKIGTAVCAKEAFSNRWFPIWLSPEATKRLKSVFSPSIENGFDYIQTKQPSIVAGDLIEWDYNPAMSGHPSSEIERLIKFIPYE